MCTGDASMASAQQTALKSMPDYGKRPDRSNKGKGYMGEIKRADGSVMTEVTTRMNVDGKDMDFPLITKYSTKEDIEYMKKADVKSKDFLDKAPAGMVDRAIKHAMERKKSGLSVYAD